MPFMSLLLNSNLPQLLYYELILKLRVNRNFPSIMIQFSAVVGSLGLLSIEIEQLVEIAGLVIL